MPTFLADVRFAVRTYLKTPAFTLSLLLTIALGVGATTAMWTVVDHVLLRALPFRDSDRVSALCETSAKTAAVCVASPANVADWAGMVPGIEAGGVARDESFVARVNGVPVPVRGGIASPGFFHAIALDAAMGRTIEPADLPTGSNRVAVVSHRFWREQLGADPAAVGRDLDLDGQRTRVIGVLPEHAYVPQFDAVDLWKPLTASIDDTTNRGWRGFMAVIRRQAGVTPDVLATQLEAARARLEVDFPDDNRGWGVRLVPLRDQIVGSSAQVLWLLFVAVGLVMAIASTNVAGLLLVRAGARDQEFMIRASLGGSRWRLARQILTESLVVAMAGGALGLLGASWATRAVIRLAPADLPRLDEVGIDWRVAGFALTLAAVSAAIFGLAPARMASRLSAAATSATRVVGAATGRLRSALVVGELALALVLLVGAGLVTRTFIQLSGWAPGFDRQDVTVAFTLMPPDVFQDINAAVASLDRVRDEVAAVPGVVNVGLGSAGPLFGGTESGTLQAADGQVVAPGDGAAVNWFDVDPHYFATLGRRLVRGRDFAPADAAGSAPVAIVNERFVARHFPGVDPIGRRVTIDAHPAEIVGIVADVPPFQPDQPKPSEIYWPIRQFPRFGAFLVMRVAPGVEGVDTAVRARIAAVHPSIQVGRISPLERYVSRTLVSPRFNAVLIGTFAAVALALAAIGLYGVMASTVAARTREFGVRLALGATPAALILGVARHAAMLALLGLVAGAGGAWLFTRSLSALLHGVPPGDPLTLGLSGAAFAVVALAAGVIPARRVSRIDPVVALRQP